jgi:phosphoribosylformylglycinamidine synthase PurS subunit
VKARVLVRPKAGILDPQGAAAERALGALGFEGVREVRIGRLIELEVTDPATRARASPMSSPSGTPTMTSRASTLW